MIINYAIQSILPRCIECRAV